MFKSFNLQSQKIRINIALSLAFIVALVAFPEIGAEGIKRGLNLSYTVMIPSLFPFLFIVDYFQGVVNHAVYHSPSKVLRGGLGRVVNIVSAVVFSFIGGFPMGARALSRLCEQGVISKKKASRLLCCCVNAGPAFVIGSVGAGMLGSYSAGLVLFLSLTLASLLCFVVFNLFGKRETEQQTRAWHPPPPKPSFVDSVATATRAVVSICSFVVLFSCIIQYALTVSGNLAFKHGWQSVETLQWAIGFLLEVSTACNLAGSIGSMNGLLMAAASVSFCSLSILFQVGAVLKKSSINMRPLLISRLLHIPTTLLILKLIIKLFPGSVSVFLTTGATANSLYYGSPVFSLFLFLVGLVFVAGKRPSDIY